MTMARKLDIRRIEVIDDDTATMFRELTPARRAEMASLAHRSARIALTARVKQLQPAWSDQDVHREMLRRLLGDGATRYLEACG